MRRCDQAAFTRGTIETSPEHASAEQQERARRGGHRPRLRQDAEARHILGVVGVLRIGNLSSDGCECAVHHGSRPVHADHGQGCAVPVVVTGRGQNPLAVSRRSQCRLPRVVESREDNPGVPVTLMGGDVHTDGLHRLLESTKRRMQPRLLPLRGARDEHIIAWYAEATREPDRIRDTTCDDHPLMARAERVVEGPDRVDVGEGASRELDERANREGVGTVLHEPARCAGQAPAAGSAVRRGRLGHVMPRPLHPWRAHATGAHGSWHRESAAGDGS